MKHPHQTFGTPVGAYVDRPGAYILPMVGDEVAVVRTPKGLFLLGGGIDPGENHAEAIIRECLEETGCRATVGDFVCSADAYTTHWGDVPYHPVQYYYLGEISEPIQAPVELDHDLLWLKIGDVCGRLFSPMQNWALETCLEAMGR